ncbi:right-handed parallel beta-helix repeat-containing protein [Wenzhouxiangella sp. XN79A]|uniref:right-handed parallel beta-helix repeat-containing protein n=1 Tax=Wenzhouxiangella sp. XN79A TaxID=2724193 RepID=UPI00144A9A81|nr:right-handed parallel beta-helix repeat-containing protein [Wenzhouxiangella sp. XN79A]NKI35621.1 right-handed parallel beta-helix repeat-containing protein [Wenzhouxiangella sp. XN79A]
MTIHNRTAARLAPSPQRTLLVTSLTAALAAVSGAAIAADFPVSSSADAGPGSLREAIAQANTNPGADTISFSGVSSITLTSGQIDITDDLTVNGPVDGVVISGNNTSRIFGVTQQGTSLDLDRVVLVDGRAEDAGGLGNCTEDTWRGGAICALGPLGLRDSRILDSEAVDSRGGAIFVATDGLVALEDCALIGNTAFRQGGAASIGAGNLIVSNCTISSNATSNTSAYGGALYVDGPATIDGSTFSGNATQGQNGDGAALWLRGDTQILNSTLSGNVTTGLSAQGAAIMSREGNLTLRSVTVTDNVSAAGGAISFEDNLPRTFDLVSTVLSGNTGPEGNLQAFADVDGPITVNAQVSLFGDPINEIDGTSFGNQYLDDPVLGPLTDNGCAVPSGVSGLGIVPAAGCAPTHLPQLGSPVIDAGENGLDAFDQRGSGFPRQLFDGVDIGAVEFEGAIVGPPLPPATPVPTLSNWTLALLGALMGGLGVIASRRRRVLAQR